MSYFLTATILVLSLASSQSALAQVRTATSDAQPENTDAQSVQNHVITVSRSGEAFAKPDLGILIMSIRSSSPIADEAVAANAQKAKAVESAFAGLGIAPAAYQISSVTFGQGGGPRFGLQQPEMAAAYEANQYVYVFFESAELNDVARLTERTATVIEALRKAGALPANTQGFGPIMPTAAQGSLIIYTIKDPTQYEHQALQKAIARARDAAQDIATGAGVQITGLRNVQSG